MRGRQADNGTLKTCAKTAKHKSSYVFHEKLSYYMDKSKKRLLRKEVEKVKTATNITKTQNQWEGTNITSHHITGSLNIDTAAAKQKKDSHICLIPG